MDYLDYELMMYQEGQDATCDICGEYNSEEWRCDCCHDCDKTYSACECGLEEEEEILGI